MVDFSKFNIPDDCFDKNYRFAYFGQSYGQSYIDPKYSNYFHRICEIILLESSSRKAREVWQLSQLNNLLRYASERSNFWKKRLSTIQLESIEELKNISIQTREDVRTQVCEEGNISEEMVYLYHTSGSSGIPVKFYWSQPMSFNDICIKQAINRMIGMDLKSNMTVLFASSYMPYPGFKVKYTGCQSMYGFFNTGVRRQIYYSNPNIEKFIDTIKLEKIGCLGVNPYMMDTLLQKYSVEEMKKDGLTSWIPIGGKPSEQTKQDFIQNQIPIISFYSSDEIGLIGYECKVHEGHFHICGSNVIAECIPDENLKFKNDTLGRILLTKLDSVATPFIRYDIGDIGELLYKCPCGHDGQTIKNLYGRAKNLVRKMDGSIWPFLIQIKNHSFISNYKEHRFIQTKIDTIRIQIGGISSISEDEANQWAGIVYDQLGKDGINIEIELLDHIDWGESTKKIPFKSLVI
jgi:phenylacetate-coenzyme A ligase PaaK-like adenylate-forming protein